jgi:hypothetical protein
MEDIVFSKRGNEVHIHTHRKAYLGIVDLVTPYCSNIGEEVIKSNLEGGALDAIAAKFIGDGSLARHLSGKSVVPTVSELQLMIIGGSFFQGDRRFEQWIEMTILSHIEQSGKKFTSVEKRLNRNAADITGAVTKLVPGMEEDDSLRRETKVDIEKYRDLWGEGGDDLRQRKESLERELMKLAPGDVSQGEAISLWVNIESALSFCKTEAFRSGLTSVQTWLEELGVFEQSDVEAYRRGLGRQTPLGELLVRQEFASSISELPSPSSVDELVAILLENALTEPIDYQAAFESEGRDRVLVISDIVRRYLVRYLEDHPDWLREIAKARRYVEINYRKLGLKREDTVIRDPNSPILADLVYDQEDGRNVRLAIAANILSSRARGYLDEGNAIHKRLGRFLGARRERTGTRGGYERDIILMSILGISLPEPPDTRIVISESVFTRLESIYESLPSQYEEYYMDSLTPIAHLGSGEKLGQEQIEQIATALGKISM